MSIHGIDNSGLTPIRPQPSAEQNTNAQGQKDVASQSSGPDRDRVEISPAARALASQAASDVQGPSPSESTLSADRLRNVLGRIGEGFYDRPDVQAIVAQRVQGDLQSQIR